MRRIIIVASLLSLALLASCATLHQQDKLRDQTL
jgi:hypothetical protein